MERWPREAEFMPGKVLADLRAAPRAFATPRLQISITPLPSCERRKKRNLTQRRKADFAPSPHFATSAKGAKVRRSADEHGFTRTGRPYLRSGARFAYRPRKSDEQELIPTVLGLLTFASIRVSYSCPFAIPVRGEKGGVGLVDRGREGF
jgi:hypothetical protein